MIIKVWETRLAEVEVSFSDAVKIVINTIRENFDLKNVDTIESDDKMYEYVEYATSHSWTKKEDRGTATPDQRKAMEVINWLTDFRRKP